MCLLLGLIMAPESPRGELLQAALYHDLAEATTGDLPAPVKWQLGEGLRDFFDLEERVKTHWLRSPASDDCLTAREKEFLRAADFLEAVWTVVEQRYLGNQYMDLIFRRLEAHGATFIYRVSPAAASIFRELRRAFYSCSSDSRQNPVLREIQRNDFWKSPTAVGVPPVPSVDGGAAPQ
jgi:5'-deoxynucleotidase YfbR-like HD superfamily hydrolase